MCVNEQHTSLISLQGQGQKYQKNTCKRQAPKSKGERETKVEDTSKHEDPACARKKKKLQRNKERKKRYEESIKGSERERV